jgi:hypothetical protein
VSLIEVREKVEKLHTQIPLCTYVRALMLEVQPKLLPKSCTPNNIAIEENLYIGLLCGTDICSAKFFLCQGKGITRKR